MKLIQLETQFIEAFIVLLALKWNSCKFKIKNHTPLLCTLSYTLSGYVHKFWCFIYIHQMLLNTNHWKVLLAEHQFFISSSSVIDHDFSNSWLYRMKIAHTYIYIYTAWREHELYECINFGHRILQIVEIKVCNTCSCSGLQCRTVQVILLHCAQEVV